ncbi:hypothetical protein K458DRAFT_396230 [Lentithecium fluviatile CBS 122367]|uniref:Uncharacterized protein n=1 Tax=Lentithecium fluviatile CBS 122367 TaxID=1168545 RepID=A0A6G1IGX1_9PLEO|nr:hypothetical protein K458DRAFT_396230 [Lentithecium fluviatile CBS 122367]
MKTNTLFLIVKGSAKSQTGIFIKPFIEELHEHENCTEYFHNLLTVIENYMLLIESVHRPPPELVQPALSIMYKNVKG